MTIYKEISTQAELDRLPAGVIAVVRSGRFTACGSASVRACDYEVNIDGEAVAS